MALDPELVAPGRTAIVVNEMQRGVVGDRASLPMLVEAAAPAVAATGELVRVGRAAGVEVVHCVAANRVDAKGGMQNTVFAARARKAAQEHPPRQEDVAAFSEVVPEISVAPSDIVLPRLHSMSPFTDTGLDMILRNLGVSTVVAAGVSLNIGVFGLVIEAVNRAYDVVLVTDACAGVPIEYGRMVVDHSLGLLARRTTVAELSAIWSATALGS
ncbi:MAG: cysteine hydrolase family protein [Actinomycetota bacterium]|nr:cysteine hydrolase family protein [Actinomycetota bacterium]